MKNNILNIKYYFLLMVVALFATSCNDDDVNRDIPFDGTVQGLISERIDDVSLFVEAVERAGLSSLFSSAEENTFFAPNDAAMQVALESLGARTVSAASVEDLTTLINNHVVSGNIQQNAGRNDFSRGNLTTIGGNLIQVSTGGAAGDAIFLNGNSQIVFSDLATNGSVHVLNFPILNSAETSIAGVISGRAADADAPEFTVLNEALSITGLNATLGGTTSEFTLFAPTDAAFADIGIDATNIGTAFTAEQLTDILELHVLANRNFTLDIASGRFFTLEGGEAEGEQGLDLDVSSGEVVIEINVGGESTTSEVNITATNGTIHVVDAVLFQEPFVFDAINGTNGLSGFDGVLLGAYNAGMNAASFDYEALLSTEDDYTLLVPRFFVAPADDADLIDAIDAHIFEGLVDITDAIGSRIEARNGDEYFVTETTGGNAIINGRSTLQTFTNGNPIIEDVSVYNGLVSNFFDPFTPLPENTLAEEILDDGTFDLYDSALANLGLNDLDDVTYLYLSDAALTALLNDEEIPTDFSMLDDDESAALLALINRHIITSVFFTSDIEAGTELTNRAGATFTLQDVDGSGTLVIVSSDDGELTSIGFGMVLNVLGSNAVGHTLAAGLPDATLL